MAILFMLVAECGSDERSAHRIVQHFLQVSWTLSDGSPMFFKSDSDDVWCRDGVFWCSAFPDGVSASGASQRIVSDALRVEIAKRGYQELRSVDHFRFALIGWEAATQCALDEILQAMGDPDSLPRGLVINEDLWSKLGSPRAFERFGQRSWWRPLREEDYLNLVSTRIR
jgi:hypothetical protein